MTRATTDQPLFGNSPYLTCLLPTTRNIFQHLKKKFCFSHGHVTSSKCQSFVSGCNWKVCLTVNTKENLVEVIFLIYFIFKGLILHYLTSLQSAIFPGCPSFSNRLDINSQIKSLGIFPSKNSYTYSNITIFNLHNLKSCRVLHDISYNQTAWFKGLITSNFCILVFTKTDPVI